MQSNVSGQRKDNGKAEGMWDMACLKMSSGNNGYMTGVLKGH